MFAQLVKKFPEFLVPESSFLWLQTSAIVLYPKPNRSILRRHSVWCNRPSSSLSAKWFLPCRYFYFVLNIHVLTYSSSYHMPKTFTFLFLQTPTYCTPNQIDQFSVITHLSVLNHLLLCLPSGFVLVDISTLFYVQLRTPAHAICPKRFSVLDVIIVILRNRLQPMKFLQKLCPLCCYSTLSSEYSCRHSVKWKKSCVVLATLGKKGIHWRIIFLLNLNEIIGYIPV